VAPAVLESNIFKPAQGKPLDIAFMAPQSGRVTVKVFNVAGERVRRPYDTDTPAGVWVHSPWDGKNEQGENAGSGVYIVSVQGGGISRILKVVLIR
jgi:flagellar hook assembly protein FlgD